MQCNDGVKGHAGVNRSQTGVQLLRNALWSRNFVRTTHQQIVKQCWDQRLSTRIAYYVQLIMPIGALVKKNNNNKGKCFLSLLILVASTPEGFPATFKRSTLP